MLNMSKLSIIEFLVEEYECDQDKIQIYLEHDIQSTEESIKELNIALKKCSVIPLQNELHSNMYLDLFKEKRERLENLKYYRQEYLRLCS